MIRTKLGFKVLGLCALVFALMGIASSGAQAAGTWLVLEGATIVEKGEATLEKDTTGILHSKISGVAVLFECEKITAVGVNLAAGGTTAKGGKIKFSECITKLNGTTSGPCKPNAGGTEEGVINTKAGHGTLTLNSGEEVLEVTPDEGETFATIEMGKECSIGTKVPVIGKLYLKDCQGKIATHLEKHLIEAAAGTELWTISKTEEHKASLLGSAWAKVLIGATFRSVGAHGG